MLENFLNDFSVRDTYSLEVPMVFILAYDIFSRCIKSVGCNIFLFKQQELPQHLTIYVEYNSLIEKLLQRVGQKIQETWSIHS